MKSKSGQKLRARKSSCKNNNTHGDQSIYNLVLQLLIALTCSLISSYYSISFDWLSYPALKQFLLNPSAISSFMSPKCLFIAINIIVIILIAEWRLTNSSAPPPTDIYDEYVKRSRMIISPPRRRTINSDLHGKIVKKAEEEKPDELAKVEEIIIKTEKEEEVNNEVIDEEVVGIIEKNDSDDDKVVEEGDGGGDIELRMEELNRRVENFIARVNKRWHEEEEEMADFAAISFDKSIVVRG